MDTSTIDALFTPETLQQLFPKNRTSDFFEALFGDADEGAYEIELGYGGVNGNSLTMELKTSRTPRMLSRVQLDPGITTGFQSPSCY